MLKKFFRLEQMKKAPVASYLNFFIWLLLPMFALHSWYGPDIWFHLARGRAISLTGVFNPVPNVLIVQPAPGTSTWLFQYLIYWIYEFGGVLSVSILFAAIWACVGAARIRLGDSDRYPISGPLFWFAFVVCAQLRMEHRPEVFSYLFLSLILILLPTGPSISRSRLLLLFLIQAMWTNTHSYFPLGLAAGFANLAASIFERQHRRTACVSLAVLVTATLCHPDGIFVWKMVFQYASLLNDLRDSIEELAPTYRFAPYFWPMPVFWIYLFAISVWTVNALTRRRSLYPAFLALGGIVLGLQAFRNIPLFLILSAPATAAASGWLEPRLRSLRKGIVGSLQPALYLASGLIALSTMTGDYYLYRQSGTLFGPRLEWAEYPIGAVEYLQSLRFTGRLFCDSSDAGYVEYMLPTAQVPGDSYFSDANMSRLLFWIASDASAFQNFDKQANFTAAIVNIANSALMNFFLSSADWQAGYADSHRAVFLRATAFPQQSFRFSNANFYHGEDLRRWNYSASPTLWSEIALTRRDRLLMLTLLEDLQKSKYIPAAFVKNALAFAAANHDDTIAALAKNLPGTIF